MNLNKRVIFLSLLLVFIFSSCKSHILNDSNHILLNNSLYWSLCGEDDTPEDVVAFNGSNYHFQKLERLGNRNLWDIVGGSGNYIWLKINFEIPEFLKNKDLGLCIDYIHFADKVWINGNFAGEYGQFPPNAKSSLYIGHKYDFPQSMLNQNGNNTVLIKVYCLGNSGIDGNIILTTKKEAEISAGGTTMLNSTIYMLFSGTLIVVFLFYMIMYINNRKTKEYFYFSLLGFSTLLFSSIFFIPQFPIFSHPEFDFFIYYKIAVPIGAVLVIYFLTSFVLSYIQVKLSKWKMLIRIICLHLLIIFIIAIPDYKTLVKTSVPIMILIFGQMLYCTFDFFKGLKTKEGRKRTKIMLFSLIPLLVSILFDVIYLQVFNGTRFFYMTYFGWQISIISYFTALAIRFNKFSTDYEELNRNLENEIINKTENLKLTNAKLNFEVRRSRADMRMAAIVQQKFFPYPSRSFMGWDVAVCYTPLTEVSGDMFDFYSMGSMMDGFAIFDVSGHGIAAGLITMLSKNIIYQSFLKSRFGNQKTSTVLKDINLKITEAKGEVENYLTGILCRFSHFNDDDSCSIELANAGHPAPVMYNSLSDTIIEVKSENEGNQFGAIGLMGRNVAFQDVEATLHENDILIFYTDGLIESENDSGKVYGKDRLKKILQENHSSDAHRILNAITKDLSDFIGTHERTDDLTVIVMKRQSSKDYLQEI